MNQIRKGEFNKIVTGELNPIRTGELNTIKHQQKNVKDNDGAHVGGMLRWYMGLWHGDDDRNVGDARVALNLYVGVDTRFLAVKYSM